MTITRNQIETLYRVVGNLEPIAFELADVNGTVVDLSGKSVTCRIINLADESVKLAAGSCTITTAASGQGYYQPQSADMDTEGRYAVYFQDNSSPPRRWPYDGARFILVLMSEGDQQ